MDQEHDDMGLITVLIERFEKQRLPRALALKEKVERGEPLSSFDVLFLQEVSDSVSELGTFLQRNPECRGLATQMVNLCSDIAKKGLANDPVKN